MKRTSTNKKLTTGTFTEKSQLVVLKKYKFEFGEKIVLFALLGNSVNQYFNASHQNQKRFLL